MKRGYAGVSKLRKTLKRLEPTIKDGVRSSLGWAGREVMVDAIGGAMMQDMYRSGDMIHSIDYKVGSDGSTVIIGPGAAATTWQRRPWDNTSMAARKMSVKQKHMKWQFFKGYWSEFGTEGPVPQNARPFMQPAWENNEAGIRVRLSRAVGEALRLASQYG